MTQFTQGADVCPSNNNATIDSVIPIAVDASVVLVPFTHRYVTVDTTAGQVVHLLPDAADSLGVFFYMKRTSAISPYSAQLGPTGLDTIEGSAENFILGHSNEYVEVFSDGTPDWKIRDQRTFCLATIEDLTGNTHAVTGAYTKLTIFDNNAFTTADRCTADQANYKLIVEQITVPGKDSYKVFFSGEFQYNNNVDGAFKVFVNGVGTPLIAPFIGEGAQDIASPLFGIVNVVAPGPVDIDIRVRADTNANMTFTAGATLTIERIGG